MSAQEMRVVLLRLEGPLQSWGHQSRHRYRETGHEPTKSGVIGLIACCMGRRRGEPLNGLCQMAMAVRVDRPGVLIRDYHTVGAKTGCMSAAGKVKKTQATGEPETLVSHRFYLSDASFLVALSGPVAVAEAIAASLMHPIWPPFLGRKSCPPSTLILEGMVAAESPLEALKCQPWRPRLEEADHPPERLRCVVECKPSDPGAEIRFDSPTSFAMPRCPEHRYVRDEFITGFPIGAPTQSAYRAPRSPRMNYRARAWATRRRQRGEADRFLCVFCHAPSIITHHITYRHANNEDVATDLRSVCRRCHDALSMLESERGLTLDRIDPFQEEWRTLVLARRHEIDATRHIRRDPERERR